MIAPRWLFRESCPTVSLPPDHAALHGGITPKCVNERNITNIGDATPDEVLAISQKSCGILQSLGHTIQWLHSYVIQDKIYCLYIAPNEEMVKEHAR